MLVQTLVILSAIVFSGNSWECDGPYDNLTEIAVSPNRSAIYAPIRIKYSLVHFDLGNHEDNDSFLLRLLNYTNNFYSRLLKVISLNSSFIVPPTCGPEIITPSPDNTTGVAGADMVIYFTTYDDSLDPAPAFSGACLYDKGLHNVLAGRIGINTGLFNNLTLSDQYNVIIHQMTHILVASRDLVNLWNGSSLATPSLLISNSFTRSDYRDHLTSPNVLNMSIAAFGCNTIAGMELESLSVDNTNGFHWSKRIMFNDILTPSVEGTDIIFSTITLALFQDSGWYQVNYTYAAVPLFGHGCDFFENDCVEFGVSQFPDLFCDQPGIGCDPFNVHKSLCNINEDNNLTDSIYKYFANVTTGGDPAMEYCPYFEPIPGNDCRFGNVFIIAPETSEVVGPSSRCFDSSLIKSPYYLDIPYTACYPVTSCNLTGSFVKIGILNVHCPFLDP